jgi:hypothetical protein
VVTQSGNGEPAGPAHSEPAKVLCRIFLSWKDVRYAEEIDPAVRQRVIRVIC